MLTAKDVFEKIREAAIASTGPDDRALQIDYTALEEKVRLALGDRKIALIHINQYLPEGYEDQGHFNPRGRYRRGRSYSIWSSGIHIFGMIFFQLRILIKLRLLTESGITRKSDKKNLFSACGSCMGMKPILCWH